MASEEGGVGRAVRDGALGLGATGGEGKLALLCTTTDGWGDRRLSRGMILGAGGEEGGDKGMITLDDNAPEGRIGSGVFGGMGNGVTDLGEEGGRGKSPDGGAGVLPTSRPEGDR